jgi:uncharacterized protein (TIGR00369 family)
MVDGESARRERTVTWVDPLPSAEKGLTMSGLDYLRALQRGDLPAPPIAATLDLAMDVIEEARVVFAAQPGEHHYNPIGTVHGGLLATLLDSAMACSVHTTLPAGTRYTTLELKVNYVRPVTVDTGRILCEGRVVHRGGTVATAEGRATSERDGTLLAHGTTTCLVLPAASR